VTFSYPTRPDNAVLQDVSLEIQPGQVVALVGPSGCGKSSIIALLERWYDAQSGSISVDGIDVKSLHPHWLRDCMALVQQEPVLFGDSLAYNIQYGQQV
jgi:ABC-type multidrug transport system fused ATPase/permease subunit